VKAIIFFYPDDGSYEIFSHDVEDLLADVLVNGFKAQGKEAYAIHQTGLHDGAPLDCDKCRRLAIGFMTSRQDSQATSLKESEITGSLAQGPVISGLGGLAAQVEKAEKTEKVRQVRPRKQRVERGPSPISRIVELTRARFALIGATLEEKRGKTKSIKEKPVREPEKENGKESADDFKREKFLDAWEGLAKEDKEVSISPRLTRMIPIVGVVVLLIVVLAFIIRPALTSLTGALAKPTLTLAPTEERVELVLPTSTITPSPVPTVTPTITTTPVPTETSTPFIQVVVVPPSPTPTEATSCKPVLEVTLDDIGQTLCVTGVVTKVDPRTNGMLIIFSPEKGTFYFISYYDINLDFVKEGVCVMATGRIAQLGSSPVIVLGLNAPLLKCTE
jgi:hypothetical protein